MGCGSINQQECPLETFQPTQSLHCSPVDQIDSFVFYDAMLADLRNLAYQVAQLILVVVGCSAGEELVPKQVQTMQVSASVCKTSYFAIL